MPKTWEVHMAGNEYDSGIPPAIVKKEKDTGAAPSLRPAQAGSSRPPSMSRGDQTSTSAAPDIVAARRSSPAPTITTVGARSIGEAPRIVAATDASPALAPPIIRGAPKIQPKTGLTRRQVRDALAQQAPMPTASMGDLIGDAVEDMRPDIAQQEQEREAKRLKELMSRHGKFANRIGQAKRMMAYTYGWLFAAEEVDRLLEEAASFDPKGRVATKLRRVYLGIGNKAWRSLKLRLSGKSIYTHHSDDQDQPWRRVNVKKMKSVKKSRAACNRSSESDHRSKPSHRGSKCVGGPTWEDDAQQTTHQRTRHWGLCSEMKHVPISADDVRGDKGFRVERRSRLRLLPSDEASMQALVASYWRGELKHLPPPPLPECLGTY